MIDKLELLIALAKEKHFGRAAETAGITQPTLSSALKSLEDQLGVVLVERGSRFQRFTPEGEVVLEWARRLVGDVRTMRQEIVGLTQSIGGQLRIGVIPTALPFMTDMTIPHHAKHPGTRLSVSSLSSNAILTRMENLELDLGVSYIDNEPVKRFQTLPLYDEQYALLVSPRHRLAKSRTITWADAGRLPLCLLTPDMQNRRIIDRHLAEAGGGLPPTFETNSMMLIYTHVRSGEWVSIIPSRFIDTLNRPGTLRSVPLVEPTVTHRIGLIVPGREPFAPAVVAFMATARKAAAKSQTLTIGLT